MTGNDNTASISKWLFNRVSDNAMLKEMSSMLVAFKNGYGKYLRSSDALNAPVNMQDF